MNNTPEYYSIARDIADQLRKESKIEEATLLNESINNGSTSTEILMSLRFNLNKVINSGDISENTKAKIRQLHRYIDKLLK